MDKEMIKLAFQLGYNQGCQDLVKAAEGEDSSGIWSKIKDVAGDIGGKAKEYGGKAWDASKRGGRAAWDASKRGGRAAWDYTKNNKATVGAGALAALSLGGNAYQAYKRRKLMKRNLIQRILNSKV